MIYNTKIKRDKNNINNEQKQDIFITFLERVMYQNDNITPSIYDY